jgi:hypothetical protein
MEKPTRVELAILEAVGGRTFGIRMPDNFEISGTDLVVMFELMKRPDRLTFACHLIDRIDRAKSISEQLIDLTRLSGQLKSRLQHGAPSDHSIVKELAPETLDRAQRIISEYCSWAVEFSQMLKIVPELDESFSRVNFRMANLASLLEMQTSDLRQVVGL